LIEILKDKGAEVDYNDPFVPKLLPTRKYKFDMKSVELTTENIVKYDLVLLSTGHDYYKENSALITRNLLLIRGMYLAGRMLVKHRDKNLVGSSNKTTNNKLILLTSKFLYLSNNFIIFQIKLEPAINK